MISSLHFFRVFVLIICFLMVLGPAVFAQTDDERAFLSLYFSEEELQVISTTRSLKSITRVAENVSVVTAEDIKLMNAHTLSDVLYTINGVHVWFTNNIFSFAGIQGSNFWHVAVLLDGVLLNNLADNVAIIGAIPVQNIEKVEVIKGPASSSWGSSLGGVVNVITKSGSIPDKHDGTIAASYGERNTADYRVEAYGKENGFGYYLYQGRFESDGFDRGTEAAQNHFYSKLSYDITDDIIVRFSLLHSTIVNGEGEYPEYGVLFRDTGESLVSRLALNSALTDSLDFQIAARSNLQWWKYYTDEIGTGTQLDNSNTKTLVYGGDTQITWRGSNQTIVIGADYDYNSLYVSIAPRSRLFSHEWSAFANDTIIFGRLAVTPGIRYDDLDISGDFVSPSLGITYSIADNTILRGYYARGFNRPTLSSTSVDNPLFFFKANPDLKVEKVDSYQLGAETTALRYLWLKLSLFRHDLDDVIRDVAITDPVYAFTQVNAGKERREGVEIEFKTLPVFDTVLFAGATFTKAEDRDTGKTIKDVPTHIYNAGLKYKGHLFSALIKGNYTRHNEPDSFNAQYDDFIVDLNLLKEFVLNQDMNAELFFTARNIFNGNQYWIDVYKNPGRWVEGGVRLIF